MKFVIFHGAFGNPDKNWFPELREKLELLNQHVIIPPFPVDDWESVTKKGLRIPLVNQNLHNWISTFEKVFKTFKKGQKFCFVGHSLGCLFILHVVEKFNIRVDSAIFVSPFLDKLNKSWQIDHANETFYKTDFDFERLKKLIPTSYVLYSDNDPYVEKNHAVLFAKALDSSMIFVRKAGHMNSEVSLNEFPLVFELCNTRLDLSLYQRYLAHRKERYATDYIRGKDRKKIRLKPEDIFDEGRFHFSQLKHEGFCTFLSGLDQWDPHNRYYEDGRRAAIRMKNFTRVILVEKLLDLKKSLLIEQIESDLNAGVKIYLCMFDKITNFVEEPDFGIWDNDYLCIIKYNKGKEMSEIVLSSKYVDLEKAQEWKELILENATEIFNVRRDIENFVAKNKTSQVV